MTGALRIFRPDRGGAGHLGLKTVADRGPRGLRALPGPGIVAI